MHLPINFSTLAVLCGSVHLAFGALTIEEITTELGELTNDVNDANDYAQNIDVVNGALDYKVSLRRFIACGKDPYLVPDYRE